MQPESYELVVIGGGSAGSSAAKIAARRGRSVALIERDQLGGTCLNYGCDPTKALLHTAQVLQSAREAESLGVVVPQAHLDWNRARTRVQSIINEIRGGSHADAEQKQRERGMDVFMGQAAFVSGHEVVVNDETIRGENILIAIGAEPVIPPTLGLTEGHYYTSKNILTLKRLPKNMAILGAGPVGVEFAQMFARFGVRVTLLERDPHILPKDDPELTRELESCLRGEGVRVQCEANVVRVRTQGPKHLLVWRDGKKEHTLDTETVLVTVGRKPDLEPLALQNAGIECRDGALAVDEHLRTSVKHIWAAGDVTETSPFTHTAAAQAVQVVDNIFSGAPKPFDYTGIPWVTYTDPALAHVGLTHTQVDENSNAYSTSRLSLAELPRSIVSGKRYGQLKFTAEKTTDRLIAVDVLGAHADELIGAAALAIRERMTTMALANAIFPYPTVSQALSFAAKRHEC